jgi:hypothetical protein
MKLSNKKIKAVVLGLGSVMAAGAGQSAFAHASILNAITSGATGFSRVGVNHADNHTTPPTPIVAQSVVFPTVNPILGRSNAGTAVVALGDFFATSATGATAGTLPWTTIANAPQLVQSKDIFSMQIEQANAAGSTIGFISAGGLLQVNLHGEVPFRFTAPHFRSALPVSNPNGLVAADLCASALSIQVAVADIADPSVQPPFVSSGSAAPVAATAIAKGLPYKIDSVGTTDFVTLFGAANNNVGTVFTASAAGCATPTATCPVASGTGTAIPQVGAETAGVGYNLWVDNLTPGLGVGANGFTPQQIENGAATPKLVINRDTTINPYPANCVAAGGADPSFTITVFPSADDINALQFPGWGSPQNGNTFR